MAADESYPDELRYHREHDWARIEGDTATLGITWYAQDALGEIVHYEPPDDGGSIAQGRELRRGRVRQGRLGSDLAALGRGLEINQAVVDGARDRQRGPVRRGLARARSGSPTPARSTTCSTRRPTGSSSSEQ